jgi:hypothetical protein
VGHLHAGARRAVTATFVADKPLRLAGTELKVALQQIGYKGGPPVEWDDTLVALAAGGPPCSCSIRMI